MPRKRPPRRARRGDGSVEQLGPGRFRARLSVNGDRLTSAVVSTRDTAEKALVHLRTERDAILSGVALERIDRRTVAELGVDWLAGRESRPAQHRNAATDRTNWTQHVVPRVGQLRPAEIDARVLRRLADDLLRAGRVRKPRPRGTVYYRSGSWYVRAYVDGERRAFRFPTRLAAETARTTLPRPPERDAGLSPQTVRNVMRLLSAFLSDCVERGLIAANPWTTLSRSSPLRALVRTHYDPATVPYVRAWADVERLLRALPEPASVAYAVGALAGLRPAEAKALRWSDVDLSAGRMHIQRQVREGKERTLKGKRSRMVEIVPLLASLLRPWRLRCQGPLVVPPVRPGARWIDEETLRGHLRDAIARLGIPEVSWYQATRHTFGSHYVLLGGSLERLSTELGHSSVLVTQRHYAHLQGSTWHPSTAPKFPDRLPEGAIAGAICPPTSHESKTGP